MCNFLVFLQWLTCGSRVAHVWLTCGSRVVHVWLTCGSSFKPRNLVSVNSVPLQELGDFAWRHPIVVAPHVSSVQFFCEEIFFHGKSLRSAKARGDKKRRADERRLLVGDAYNLRANTLAKAHRTEEFPCVIGQKPTQSHSFP